MLEVDSSINESGSSDPKYQSWLGKSRSATARLESWPARALSSVLGSPAPNFTAGLPGLWHWLYFLEAVSRDELGPDGHPRPGTFMPPLPNPRRMFAGARTEYHRPLQIDREAQLVETIVAIQCKQGSSAGAIYIVTVQYEYSQGGHLCISEQRDFVYLPAVGPGQTQPSLQQRLEPVADTAWSLDFPTDPVLLFRFSALTFNSHRIHYDRQYATGTEGYPDLVVQGPLTAVLAAHCLRSHCGRRVAQFDFRSTSPLFVGQPVRIRAVQSAADTVTLTAYTPSAKPAMTVTAILD
jgi:3-methylfumaryl-CoA hydratase